MPANKLRIPEHRRLELEQRTAARRRAYAKHQKEQEQANKEHAQRRKEYERRRARDLKKLDRMNSMGRTGSSRNVNGYERAWRCHQSQIQSPSQSTNQTPSGQPYRLHQPLKSVLPKRRRLQFAIERQGREVRRTFQRAQAPCSRAFERVKQTFVKRGWLNDKQARENREIHQNESGKRKKEALQDAKRARREFGQESRGQHVQHHSPTIMERLQACLKAPEVSSRPCRNVAALLKTRQGLMPPPSLKDKISGPVKVTPIKLRLPERCRRSVLQF